MSTIEEKTFDCSFCNTVWKCKKSKYKIRALKTVSGKHWIQFFTCCPNCGRETTITEQTDTEKRRKGISECNN